MFNLRMLPLVRVRIAYTSSATTNRHSIRLASAPADLHANATRYDNDCFLHILDYHLPLLARSLPKGTSTQSPHHPTQWNKDLRRPERLPTGLAER